LREKRKPPSARAFLSWAGFQQWLCRPYSWRFQPLEASSETRHDYSDSPAASRAAALLIYPWARRAFPSLTVQSRRRRSGFRLRRLLRRWGIRLNVGIAPFDLVEIGVETAGELAETFDQADALPGDRLRVGF
jgi:hypothetical protein